MRILVSAPLACYDDEWISLGERVCTLRLKLLDVPFLVFDVLDTAMRPKLKCTTPGICGGK